jgi:hypothetical protein
MDIQYIANPLILLGNSAKLAQTCLSTTALDPADTPQNTWNFFRASSGIHVRECAHWSATSTMVKERKDFLRGI